MLAQVFSKLLHMSFAAAWLALAVVLLRILLRRAPRRVILLLWALVAVRLVCPASIESRLSLVPRPESVVQSVSLPQNPASETEPAAPAVDFHPERLWLAGTGAMLLWGLWGDLRLRRRVRVSIPQRDNVRICDEIETPFVLGAFRPKIFLPSNLEDSQAVYVLAHERAHIARRDHWWKPLGWVLLSVYWFHPLLWLAYILFCRDLEIACDERVASGLDRDGLAAYSEALLQCSTRRGALASPVAFGETGVKTRVRAILRYRKPALRVVLIALLCVLIVGALFLTDRPSAAMQLAETVLPEIMPVQEDDWTISLREWNEAPGAAPAPEASPRAAVQTVAARQPAAASQPAAVSQPAAQTVAVSQPAAQETADIVAPATQEAHDVTAAPSESGESASSDSRTLSTSQTPTYSASAWTDSYSPTEYYPARPDPQGSTTHVGDVQVIKLYP